MTAGVINAHNMFASEVQQENNFINRIKSKTKILQMYSGAPAADLYYIGNSFDNSDYVDFSKIESQDLMPSIDNGQLTLSTVSTVNWSPRSAYIEEGSNGFYGNNHAAYLANDTDSLYRYYFKDSPTSRNPQNILDNNPLTYFEYEQVHINNKPTSAKDFEFKYIQTSSTGTNQSYVDWSTFSSDSLKMNLVLEKDSAQIANYLKIIPFFGNADNLSRDILVNKIEVTNDKNEVENILSQPIYISSSFIPSSLDKVKNFFYKEAKISFSERLVKKFKIYFEQYDSVDINIKHLYYKPNPNLAKDTPYANQTRFDPDHPAPIADQRYPEIPWVVAPYKVDELIPSTSQPNYLKAEVANTNSIEMTLNREIPNRTGYCIELRGKEDGKTYRITGRFLENFTEGKLVGFSKINDNYLDYVSSGLVKSNGSYLDPYLSNSNSQQPNTSIDSILDSIVTWFNTTTSDGTKEQKYEKFKLDSNFLAIKKETNSNDTKTEKLVRKIELIRNYEILPGKRKSIGLRDINIGLENYVDAGQVVSKQYDLSSEIEYITLSAESDFSGPTTSSAADCVDYFISVDGGSKWIQLSSIESPFGNVPEVLAFNQNIENNFKLPGVSYLSSPSIPESIKSFLVKINIKKPFGQNITPIIYSYKIGVKVKKS